MSKEDAIKVAERAILSALSAGDEPGTVKLSLEALRSAIAKEIRRAARR